MSANDEDHEKYFAEKLELYSISLVEEPLHPSWRIQWIQPELPLDWE